MVRVGKWMSKPSREATEQVTQFLTKFFQTEKVWTRKEHNAFVVAIREDAKNTETVEAFRFGRSMEQRFVFSEANGLIEVQLNPQEVSSWR